MSNVQKTTRTNKQRLNDMEISLSEMDHYYGGLVKINMGVGTIILLIVLLLGGIKISELIGVG